MAVKGKVVKKESALAKFLRRKISKKKKEAAGIAALSFGDLFYDLSRIDPRYVLGANFARPSKNISSKLKIGKQNLKDLKDPRDGKPLMGEEYLNYLHTHNYAGSTHEFVTDSYMRAQGVEVSLPDKMNQPAWDRIYNGQPWQIKFDTINGVREARIKNPEIPVATDIETAEEYSKKFPDDALNVLGTTPKKLTQDILTEGKEASMEVYTDDEFFGTNIPEFLGVASVTSTIKNISYVLNKDTDSKTAVQNIAIDSVGKGASMWMGAKIGGVILGPLGAIAGAIGGAMLGGSVVDEFKADYFCEKEINDLEKKLKEYQKAADNIFNTNQLTIKNKLQLLDMTLGSETYRKKYLKENKITAELYEFLAEKFIKEKKGLERLHLRKEMWLKKFRENPINDQLMTVEKFMKNNTEIGIPHYFLNKETKSLVDSAEVLLKSLKKRGV